MVRICLLFLYPIAIFTQFILIPNSLRALGSPLLNLYRPDPTVLGCRHSDVRWPVPSLLHFAPSYVSVICLLGQWVVNMCVVLAPVLPGFLNDYIHCYKLLEISRQLPVGVCYPATMLHGSIIFGRKGQILSTFNAI